MQDRLLSIHSVPTKRPEAKQAHAPEIFAIPAEDLREDKKSSQYLPSWDFRLFLVRERSRTRVSQSIFTVSVP
eukprot:scaffold11917_cov128-Isochrysis_galbana.AAC.12